MEVQFHDDSGPRTSAFEGPIPLRDQARIQLRLEAFNLLNHPNWGGANSNATSGWFGLITGKSRATDSGSPRKYMF
jgi:hypothetical protein